MFSPLNANLAATVVDRGSSRLVGLYSGREGEVECMRDSMYKQVPVPEDERMDRGASGSDVGAPNTTTVAQGGAFPGGVL